jgi:5'-nucleotidase
MLGVGITTLAFALRNSESTVPADGSSSSVSEIVDVSILHVNDVYELTPGLTGEGGLARLASLRKRIAATTPNLVVTLAGDFLSPSALSAAVVNGSALNGRQMVDVFSSCGLDVASLGNHEFDYSFETLANRISEARFAVLSTNAFCADGRDFPGAVKSWMWKSATGDVSVGFVGAVMQIDVPYAFVNDLAATIGLLRDESARLRSQGADIVVLLSHFTVKKDFDIVTALGADGSIDVVLGGHEHENQAFSRGSEGSFVPVFKADSNARTAYHITLSISRVSKRLDVTSRLVRIDSSLPDDADTKVRVDFWRRSAFAGFAKMGYLPEQLVCRPSERLDGTEATVRNKPTLLTTLFAQSLFSEAQRAGLRVDVGLANAGSVRIDDVLPAGANITQYDVLRILPFPGNVSVVRITKGVGMIGIRAHRYKGRTASRKLPLQVTMPGSTILQLLSDMSKLDGHGSYPVFYGIAGIGLSSTPRTIRGKAINASQSYAVASTAFYVEVGDKGTSYLTTAPAINHVVLVRRLGDYRLAFIRQLRAAFP